MGPSDNETAEATQLKAMMDQHRGSLPGVPKIRKKKPALKKPPRSTAAEQKQVAKPDSYESMARRKRVQALRLRGMSYQEIGKELSISEKVAKADLEALRNASKTAVEQFHQAQQTGDSLATYDLIAAKTWELYETATDDEGNPNTNQQLKCLDLLRSLQNDKMKALHECGLLDKAPELVEHKVAYQLPWDDKMKQAVAHAMLQSALTPQLPAPVPDIIDAELIPPEAEVMQVQKIDK